MGFKMKPKSPLTKKLVSALKHKPWAAAHKERPAHSGTAEAHNAEPAAPTKKYVSDAQRKAVHASKAERSPAKKHKPGHPAGNEYFKNKPKPIKKPRPVPPAPKPKPNPRPSPIDPNPLPEKLPSMIEEKIKPLPRPPKPLTLPDKMKKHYVKAKKKTR